ncbi:hypothetical protein [Fodinicola acaciae]|uniref:hypothetical protein n=1 Tax=Fodinicola acaciae TaxID=2681555 RepID=UPI0013D1432C|nr:hypothetical protein [Fodinicola acaciae]
MPYEHILTDALSIRGMRALFDVAVPRMTPRPVRLRLFDRWCNQLQSRAFSVDILWMPATGVATTTANFPTRRVEEILLRILRETPVTVADQDRRPRPRAPA